MIVIDGAMGEGGGQILRTSLSLAMCLNKSVRIDNIRASRKKPGLLRQHLTCVKAAKAISNATVTGDEIGSNCVEFHPAKIMAGNYDFKVGTAGSTTLIFQTVLPALLMADGVSEISIEGGTHNQNAPSFDFIKKCFLPVMAKLGINVDVELKHYGFYPNGGGAWTAIVQPLRESNYLELTKRGDIIDGVAIATSSGIPKHVTERELKYVKKKCLWTDEQLQQNIVQSYGPGNIISLELKAEHVTEVFESVGSFGVNAERVAGRAVRDMKRYQNIDVAVAEHLCDQLLLPLILGSGGRFTTLKPSLHSITNIQVIKQFIDCEITTHKLDNEVYEVYVSTKE